MVKSRCLSLLIYGTVLLLQSAASQDSIRPIRDDIGYCWDGVQMDRLIGYIDSIEQSGKPEGTLIGGISPHDDYLYAARMYYPLFRTLRAKEAVIFGVTHGTVRRAIGDPKNVLLFDSYTHWLGPYGQIRISPLREHLLNSLDTTSFKISNKAHRLEHSIEGLLPFLQHFNPDIRITPVMVTAMEYERMSELSGQLADAIADYMRERNLLPGEDIVFLISADANHYGDDFNNSPFGQDKRAHSAGIALDRELIRDHLSGPLTPDKVKDLQKGMKKVLWCGRYSIPFGTLSVVKTMWKLREAAVRSTPLRYSDTYTEGVLPLQGTGMGITAPFSLKHWVGFFSAAFVVD